jgi:hypothetical protein
MRKIALIFVLALMLLQPVCFAASDAITIGNVTIALGDAKQTVISKLWADYDLRPVKAVGDTFNVVPKKGTIDQPITIAFKNGVVASVTKEVGKFDETRIVDALFKIMEGIVRDNGSRAEVEVGRSDGKNIDSLTLKFPVKWVTIAAVAGDDGNTVKIIESMQ